MPITWSGSLLAAQGQRMIQCSDKNPLLWENCLQVRYTNTSFLVRGEKNCCLFVLSGKKMSGNLGYSSQHKFTLKNINVQFEALPIVCSSKRSAY